MWLHADRTALYTITSSAEEFLESLQAKLQQLLLREQAVILAEHKNSLAHNEYVILCDFAENSSFILQVRCISFTGPICGPQFILLSPIAVTQTPVQYILLPSL
jgi:hypothetical protein